MLDIGSVIDGKYKILSVIGKGGMSVVYLALNERANKSWAIKEVRKDGVQNYEVVRQNLIAETDMLKKLNHPNLPSIIDVIDREGSFLIVMDYIEGKPLSDILKESGAQPQENVIEWSKQLCDVLGYLHSRRPSIIYRDMKPSNVMLKPDGNIALIDFGTAREFKSAAVADTTCLGTRGYAAPEQFGGQGQTDARTDIYCLGATMYHLVTGHNPATPPYEMYPIRQWNPMLSSGLEEIILRCTQLNPNDRYQSCAELLYALDNVKYLEVENKKVQNVRWRLFLVMIALTLVMAIASVGFKISAETMISETYQSYIDKAQDYKNLSRDEEKNERIKNCKEAINVNPNRVDAYCLLFETYFNDQDLVFTYDEYKRFLTDTSEYLTGDSAPLNEEFADKLYYNLGLALYFGCDNQIEGQNASLRWLDKAKEYCSDEKKKKAKVLSLIQDYIKYSQNQDSNSISGINSVTGEKNDSDEKDYSDFWNNLLEMHNIAFEEFNEKKDSKTNNINFRIPLQALDLCLHVINDSENLYHFKNANIKKETILSFVNQLSVDRDSIENFIMSNDNNQDYAIYLTQLHNQIGNIDKTIESINQSYS